MLRISLNPNKVWQNVHGVPNTQDISCNKLLFSIRLNVDSKYESTLWVILTQKYEKP